MKKYGIGLLIVMIACVAAWKYIPRNEDQILSDNVPIKKEKIHEKPRHVKLKLSDILVDTKSPDAQSRAVEAAEMIGDADRLDERSAKDVLDFLRNGKPSDMSQEVWQERVNVLLNALRFFGEKNNGSVAGLVDYMLELANDSSGRILQIYALQHLASWSSVEQDKAEVERISNTLWSIANQRNHPAAGIAVLMLSDMNRYGVIADSEKISAQAEILVGGAELAQDVRVSAIHACVDRSHSEVVPSLRAIAQDVSLVSTLRKAAIHGIGQLGTVEDLALLDALPQGDTNLALAIIPAKKELEKRLGQKR